MNIESAFLDAQINFEIWKMKQFRKRYKRKYGKDNEIHGTFATTESKTYIEVGPGAHRNAMVVRANKIEFASNSSLSRDVTDEEIVSPIKIGLTAILPSSYGVPGFSADEKKSN